MAPKITVVTTTFRPWDRLLNQLGDLKLQTFRDFEWIVVDDLKEQRPFALSAPFPIQHVLPARGVSQSFAPAHADNTAIALAGGELVYWMNDYVRLTPGILERHWQIYQEHGPDVIIQGPLIPMDGQMPFPPRRGDVPIDDGLEECICGHACWQHSAGRNDSAPLEQLIAVNGLDENFDGDRGGSDVDLAMRLMMNGCRMLVDTRLAVFEYAHHPDSNPAYPWDKVLPEKGAWDRIQKGYKPKQAVAKYGWEIADVRSSNIICS